LSTDSTPLRAAVHDAVGGDHLDLQRAQSRVGGQRRLHGGGDVDVLHRVAHLVDGSRGAYGGIGRSVVACM
jgi:hypothetical protein